MKKYIILILLVFVGQSDAQLQRYLQALSDHTILQGSPIGSTPVWNIIDSLTVALDSTIASLQKYGYNLGNYTTLGSAATASANDTSLLIVSSRVSITSNTTLSGPSSIQVNSGGRINITSGDTLFVNIPFYADRYQVFEGSGVVRFSAGVVDAVKPEWFGALGDGSTDDSFEFNKAIQAMPDSGGTLQLSAGSVFKIDSLEIFTDNITISGPEGSYGIIKIGSGQVVTGIGSDVFATNVSPAGVSTPLRNISFRNIRFIDQASGSKTHFQLSQITNLIFDNCIFVGDGSAASTGSFAAIRYEYSVNVNIINCTFENYVRSVPVVGNYGTPQNSALNNYPKLVFTGNKFFNTKAMMVHNHNDVSYGDQSDNGEFGQVRDSSMAVITGNIGRAMTSGSQAAIGLQHMSKCVVNNNVIIGYSTAIDAETADETIMDSNYIWGGGVRIATTNLDTSMYKVIFSNNYVDGAGIAGASGSGLVAITGVASDSSSSFIFDGNMIKNSKADGLFLNNVKNVIVATNQFIDNLQTAGFGNGGIGCPPTGYLHNIMIRNNQFINTDYSSPTMLYGVVVRGSSLKGISLIGNQYVNMATGDVFGESNAFRAMEISDQFKSRLGIYAPSDSLLFQTGSNKNIVFKPGAEGRVVIGDATSSYSGLTINGHTSAGTPDTTLYVYNDAGSTAEAGIFFGAAVNPFAANISSNPVSATAGTLKFRTKKAGTMTQAVTIDSLQNVAIGASNPSNASVKLDIQGTTGALRLPVLSTTQRNALTALEGMLIFNTTVDSLQFYNGTAWKNN